MEQSHSWEASSLSASQNVLRILWNPEDHYRVLKEFDLCPSPEPDQATSHPAVLFL
jgi:hypothetical protein